MKARPYAMLSLGPLGLDGLGKFYRRHCRSRLPLLGSSDGSSCCSSSSTSRSSSSSNNDNSKNTKYVDETLLEPSAPPYPLLVWFKIHIFNIHIYIYIYLVYEPTWHIWAQVYGLRSMRLLKEMNRVAP